MVSGKPTWFRVCGSLYLLVCSVPGVASGPQGSGQAPQTTDSLQTIGGTRLRYPGPRWSLLYGSYQGVEEFAVNELQRMVQRSIPYVLEVLPADRSPDGARNLILVGTAGENPRIAELGRRGAVKYPRRRRAIRSPVCRRRGNREHA